MKKMQYEAEKVAGRSGYSGDFGGWGSTADGEQDV